MNCTGDLNKECIQRQLFRQQKYDQILILLVMIDVSIKKPNPSTFLSYFSIIQQNPGILIALRSNLTETKRKIAKAQTVHFCAW